MNFKQQFEFHKVPEWDDHYFHYEAYLEKIEIIIKKMKRYKLQGVSSVYYDLSESFEIINQEGAESPRKQSILVIDASLNYSFGESNQSYDLEVPLLSLNTDVKELLEELVHESKEIYSFYERETSRIINNFGRFYK
jgi:hypothetical protein